MASRSGRVRVYFDADTSQLERGTRGAEASLGRFSRSAGRTGQSLSRASRSTRDFDSRTRTLGSTLKSAALAAGSAAAAYVGISQAKAAIEATTDLAKATLTLKKGFGLTIGTASELGAVLTARGADATSVGMAFNTLSRQVEAAKKGSTTAADAFHNLGISQRELKDSSPDQLLFQVAKGMQELGAGTERTAATSTLFGRGWKTLGPVLREGSDSLKEQLDLANKYGATFSGGSIKSIKDLIQTERELKIAQLGLQVQFTKDIAPALISTGRAFAGLINSIRQSRVSVTGIIQSLRQFWESAGLLRDTVGKSLSGILQYFRGAGQVIRGVVRVISGLLTGDFGRAWKGVRDIFRGGIQGIVGLLRATTAPIRAIGQAIGQALSGPLSTAWDAISGTFRTGLDKVKGFIGDIFRFLNKIPIVGKAVPDSIPGIGDVAFAGKKVTTPTVLVGEEAPQHPEYVLATNPAYRQRNVMLWQEAGHELGVPGFALGGIIDRAKHLMGGTGGLPSPGDIIGSLPKPNLPFPLGGFGSVILDAVKSFIRDTLGDALGFGPGPKIVQGVGPSPIQRIIGVGRQLQSLGFQVSENPAFGGVTGVHASGSYHYRGRAIDVNWPNAAQEPSHLIPLYNALAGTHPTELFYRNRGIPGPVAGHFDHLHLAYRKGGVIGARKGMVIKGPSSWFSPGDAPNVTADGKHTAADPGFAIRDRSTLGDWFQVSAQGKSGLLQHIDWGPAAWTGRDIDITAAGLGSLGLSPGNFRTGTQAVARWMGRTKAAAQQALHPQSRPSKKGTGTKGARGPIASDPGGGGVAGQLAKARRILARPRQHTRAAVAWAREVVNRPAAGGGEEDSGAVDDTQAQIAALLQEIRDLQAQQTLAQVQATNLLNSQSGPNGVIASALAAVVSGQIGGTVGLGFSSPSFSGGLARY